MKKRIFFRITALLIAFAFLLFSFGCAETEDPNKGSSSTPKKRIAFTFDDGPTAGVTDKILDKLEAIGGRATFFQVANRHNYISNNVYERIAELGCEIGSHTFSHPSQFSSLSESATREQLEKSLRELNNEFSKPITLFRPVGGDSTVAQRQLAAERGRHTIYWSIDPEDWRPQTNKIENVEDFITEKVLHIIENAEDGDIILMHEMYLSSYEIFSRAADELVERGFELVTVSEILGFDKNTPKTSKAYAKGESLFSDDAVG